MISSRPDRTDRSPRPGRPDDELARLTYVLRMFAVLLTTVSLADAAQRVSGVIAGLVLGACLSFGAMWWWRLLAPTLRRHPMIFAVDAALSSLLVIVAGPGGPFFIYTLATAMLAGILYGPFGAGFFSVMLCSAYWYALHLWDLDDTFMTVVGLPSMYPAFGLGAAYIAEVYRRQASDAVRLAQASSLEAAMRERVRLARELHDSVTKTTTGVALQASALYRRLAAGDGPTSRSAEQLWAAAERAAKESREVLVTLRQETLAGPFSQVLEAVIDEIEEETGVAIGRDDLDQADIESSAVRFEIGRIVAEALRNSAIHSGAEKIEVAVNATDAAIEIVVRDDGRGFDPSTHTQAAAARGHFGLAGMAERASQIGGALHIDSSLGEGTTVTVQVARELTNRLDGKTATEDHPGKSRTGEVVSA